MLLNKNQDSNGLAAMAEGFPWELSAVNKSKSHLITHTTVTTLTPGNRTGLEPTTGLHLDDEMGDLIDELTNFIIRLILLITLSPLIGLFGTTANIINIIVFIKQGLFSAGSTVNLFFLAVADLGVCLTNLLHSIGYGVILADIPDLPVDPFAIVYLSLGWPLTIFITINRLVTAYVAFERCMCVVIPFHVQRIFTPRRSLQNLTILFAYGIFSHVPVYLTERILPKMQDGTNSTKLVLVFSSDREFWQNVVLYTNYFVINLFSIATVLVCTIVTILYVNTSKKWRASMSKGMSTPQQNSGTDAVSLPGSKSGKETGVATESNSGSSKKTNDSKQTKNLSSGAPDKESRLVKMITTISAIFCVCYIPELTFLLVRSVDDRVRVKGQYHRLVGVMYSLTYVSAAINSSINIFVYYRMSSNYRKEFLSYCGRKKQTN